MFNRIDITRFSQKALPIAKSFDENKSGALEKNEYKKFITLWQEQFGNENPLLMQLHITSLSDEAKKIAETCNTDSYKEVLTETELIDFIEKYEKSGLKTPFKDGVDLNAIVKGEYPSLIQTETLKTKNRLGIFNLFSSGYQLFKNLVKKEQMNYKGADKYFHAVGNFEGVKAGDEKSVEKLCSAQDKIKRKSFDRSEADFAEDLYANWLGREMVKIYPNQNPHELFRPIAPSGFDIEESKKGWVEIICKNGLSNTLKSLGRSISEHFNESFLAKKNKQKDSDIYIVQNKYQ